MRRHVALALLLVALVAGCDEEEPLPPRPPPQAALPPPSAATTETFADSGQCAQCHLADAGPVLRDPAGHDISPVGTWRASMMSLAARDPFYLAVVSEERQEGDAKQVDSTCLRCHAPAGHVETSGALTFEELLTGKSPAAVLGRDGVTCALCHQIKSDRLGTETSFTGGFVIGPDRAIYGPHNSVVTEPMQFFVNFTPTFASHMGRSEVCATCHTVIVKGVVEQATYLEWRSSSLSPGKPCQWCHVPQVDEAQNALSEPISKFPAGLAARTPYGRHEFMGGNAYLLRLVAENEAWVQSGIPAADLQRAIGAAEAHLRSAAKLTAVGVERKGGGASFRIIVENQTGHKLPTGYPSRRMWLHVVVRANGKVVFESGALDRAGRLAGDDDGRVRKHLDVVSSQDRVQVWGATLVDADDRPTHRALAARRVGRDDRILPAGFAPTGMDVTRTATIGVFSDPDFQPGSDGVGFTLGSVPVDAEVEVTLLYQTLTRDLIEKIDRGRTPLTTQFVDMARASPPEPVTMAELRFTIP